ncbi:hypothetical protein DPEC_G00198600 [Dallia pectoralis]|uniref:Uncharacterized protein n=1 Tax=Dallia pectoralis TaxID=75939 RepID=A0ACC2G8E2_DALPE|nr:hypothetical protein DPEC_G00198600 [Dallia pectoralis]
MVTWAWSAPEELLLPGYLAMRSSVVRVSQQTMRACVAECASAGGSVRGDAGSVPFTGRPRYEQRHSSREIMSVISTRR